MALICDPDYLIHSLRLNYLKHVEDPYGPRIITFDPRYQSNPHIVATGSADVDRWPELNMPQSPQVSDDEGTSGAPNGRRRHSGFPGATGLKYTQTIMGNKAGIAGMRVSGRRTAPEKVLARRSISATSSTPRRTRADSEPTPAPASNIPNGSGATGSPDTYDESLIQVSKRRSAGGSSLQEMATALADKPELENKAEPGSLTNVPMALQSMSHIAAVQARRQRRRAHFKSGGNAARPIIISETKVNPEESSSEGEAEAMSGSLMDDDGYIVEVEGSLEAENDGFDPDFAPPRIGFNSDSSDLLNSMSNSALSTSVSSAFNSSLQVTGGARGRGKLSPVSEARPSDDYSPGNANVSNTNVDGAVSDTTTQRDAGTPIEEYFEIIKPPVQRGRLEGPLKHANEQLSSHKIAPSEKRSSQPLSDLDFTRCKVPPVRPATSGLTAKLASSDTSTNPFTELYALISGRAEIASMEVIVYFPHATKPANQPMKLNIRKDATIEEVIGFSLWSYWEEGWLPKLDEGVSEEKKKERLSAAGWILRIAEDDGEVDEDFPAPDRMGKISKFNFDAYAILEATPAQAAQNAQLEAKIVRRPSRIIVSKKKQEPTGGLALPAPLLGPSVSNMSASALGTSVGILGSSLNISSSHGSQVLLRIRMANVDDKATHYSTTISVYSTMYMQEVLEHICRKRKIDNPKDWALLSDDFKILVPLDRTVASLEGNLRLVLIQRELLPLHGFAIDGDKRTARSIDPNASIFKRISEVQPKGKGNESSFDVYKRYKVWRKVPMLVTRLERTLAIDGDYIHIMPSANKARGVFDSGKTVSYHIKSVVNCSQSAKSSDTFKIIFKRDGGDKRYDFEAENAKQATEISMFMNVLISFVLDGDALSVTCPHIFVPRLPASSIHLAAMLKTVAASARYLSTNTPKVPYLHSSCRLLHSVTEVPESGHGIESITQLPLTEPSPKRPKRLSKERSAVILEKKKKKEKGNNDRLASSATPAHRRLQDLLNRPGRPSNPPGSRRSIIKEKPIIKTRFKNSVAAQSAIRPAVQAARVKEVFQREGAEKAIDFILTAPRDTLSTVVWNTLLAELMIIGKRKRAYEIYIEMKRRGFPPTSRTFKTMLTGMNSIAVYEWPSHTQNLERCHKLYDALESYAEICKQQILTKEFPAICAARGAYVRILGKINDYQRIVDIFYKTDDAGPLSRDKYLYEALLWGLLLRKEAEQVGALSLAEQNASDAKFYWRSLEKDLERGMEIDSHVIRPFIKLMAAGRPVDQQFGFNVVREFFGLVPPGEDAPTSRLPLCIFSFQAILELCNKSKKFRLCTYFMKQVSDQVRLNLKTVPNLTIGYRHINEQLIALGHLAAVGSFDESERAVDAIRYLKSAAAIEAQKLPQRQRFEDLTLHTETVTLALGVCWRCGDWERAAEIFSLVTDLTTEQFLDKEPLASGTSKADEYPVPKKRLVYTTGFTHLARTALSTEDAPKMRQCLRMMRTYGVDVAPFETHNNFYKIELAKAMVRLVDAASAGWKSEEVQTWREMKHESIQVLSKRIPIERPEQEDAGLGSEKYIGKLQQAIDFELSSRGSV